MNKLTHSTQSLIRAELAAVSTVAAAWWLKRPSKYATAPFAGNIKIGQHSSLKKLMRGAARGKLNPIVLDRINLAERVAADRATVYKNSSRTVH